MKYREFFMTSIGIKAVKYALHDAVINQKRINVNLQNLCTDDVLIKLPEEQAKLLTATEKLLNHVA
jgi:hypothetical protein